MVTNCTEKNKIGVLWGENGSSAPFTFWCPSQIQIFSNFNFLEVHATIIGSIFQTCCCCCCFLSWCGVTGIRKTIKGAIPLPPLPAAWSCMLDKDFYKALMHRNDWSQDHLAMIGWEIQLISLQQQEYFLSESRKKPCLLPLAAHPCLKRGFFQSHDITLVPRALPRGEGISQFSQISQKSALNGKSLYTDDSCEIILKC